MRKRSWASAQLREAVYSSTSIRQVLIKLGLIPAGGNYMQVQQEIRLLRLSTKHFSGKGWRKGTKVPVVAAVPLNKLLTRHTEYQSHKLKKRLYVSGLKSEKCEECGWAKQASGGRIPLELDHINGIRTDNRLSNLRILCPNCHSLKPTHRGRNKGRTAQARVA